VARPLAGKGEEQAAATALALVWLEWLSRTPEGIDAWLALAGEALARR